MCPLLVISNAVLVLPLRTESNGSTKEMVGTGPLKFGTSFNHLDGFPRRTYFARNLCICDDVTHQLKGPEHAMSAIPEPPKHFSLELMRQFIWGDGDGVSTGDTTPGERSPLPPHHLHHFWADRWVHIPQQQRRRRSGCWASFVLRTTRPKPGPSDLSDLGFELTHHFLHIVQTHIVFSLISFLKKA